MSFQVESDSNKDLNLGDQIARIRLQRTSSSTNFNNKQLLQQPYSLFNSVRKVKAFESQDDEIDKNLSGMVSSNEKQWAREEKLLNKVKKDFCATLVNIIWAESRRQYTKLSSPN